MKIIFGVIAVVLVVGVALTLYPMRGAFQKGAQFADESPQDGFWDLETQTLDGAPITFDNWRGQVALVVNVASQCGLTPQYEGLQSLYTEFKDEGFVILAFPSNNFGKQEPGAAAEIREFCDDNYKVTFPMFQKSVVVGEDKNNIYQYMTEGGLEEPTWNFTKYLVNKEGRVIARFAPRTTPDDPELKAAIVGALNP
ncbi:MAG: glutathione peroxidase [Candidatus Krumholzibacteriia bacterium]